jgi:hypothetical protein
MMAFRPAGCHTAPRRHWHIARKLPKPKVELEASQPSNFDPLNPYSAPRDPFTMSTPGTSVSPFPTFVKVVVIMDLVFCAIRLLLTFWELSDTQSSNSRTIRWPIRRRPR